MLRKHRRAGCFLFWISFKYSIQIFCFPYESMQQIKKILFVNCMFFMKFQHNNAPVLAKFSPNVARRVLGTVVICQQIWNAKKSAFQDVDVLMVNFWTTQELVYLQHNVLASFKERLLNLEKIWTWEIVRHGE